MIWRSILLTPNILGKDGVSALSREMARALPPPALIVSLHDDSRTVETSPVGIEVRGAHGSRVAFVATALNAARRSDGETAIVSSHLHLAPVAKAVLAPKLNHIESSRASLVATGNPGCLMQIGAGLRRAKLRARTVHPVDLLDAS